MSDVRTLATKMRLLRFDGEVLEIFTPDDSTRDHASLISEVEIHEKKQRLTFEYGQIPRPTMIGFDADELAAVGEFMRAVVAAGPS